MMVFRLRHRSDVKSFALEAWGLAPKRLSAQRPKPSKLNPLHWIPSPILQISNLKTQSTYLFKGAIYNEP